MWGSLSTSGRQGRRPRLPKRAAKSLAAACGDGCLRSQTNRSPADHGGLLPPAPDEARYVTATTRSATTVWHGSLLEGSGRVELESSGLGGFDVTWASRAEDPAGRTSPEELIGAAHSSCFSMALSNGSPRRAPPETLETTAEVTFQPGEGITGSTSRCEAGPRHVRRGLRGAAERAKTGCPVSQALAGTTITLDARRWPELDAVLSPAPAVGRSAGGGVVRTARSTS